ncbi:MAG: TonB-dependent receptor [Bacteroidales bacterium]|jgi:TonB-linked SusC/RagA family outer membrane protein|nr:TonB-dependent receptor [Bacteroidales bacterium]
MKKIPIFLMFLIVSLQVFAQQVTIEGVVTSADDGETLPGVTIIEKGTSNGTITNIDGYYQITVSADAVLQFSFVGIKTKEIPVAGQSRIDIALETELIGLEEVVVIGYGTAKKKDITGAVSVVDNQTIEDLKPVKVEQALQGTMAGVNVTPQSGSPGAGLNIRIRGISTNGDASPTVIIDGYAGDLGTLNPSDIESITILKDAQAAIYGTAGANGVILVTTKTGKKNTDPVINVNSSYGIQETTRKLPVLDATEYAVLLNESYAANGQELPNPDVSLLGQGTDWQGELFQTAPISNTDLNVSGGSDNMVYTISGSNLNQEGIIGGDKTGYDRNTARVSLAADIYEWLKVNTSLTYTHIDRRSVNDYALGSVLFNAINMPPTLPVYDESGEYTLAPVEGLGIEIINPLAQVANTYNDYNLNKFNGNFGLETNFAEHFSATARIGFNTSNSDYRDFFKEIDYGGKVFDHSFSSVNENRINDNEYTFDVFMNYDNTFFDDHHTTFTIGSTVYKTWGDGLYGYGTDVPYNSWDYASIGATLGGIEEQTASSYVYDQRRLSYFGRIQYDYKEKYLLSAMLRRDASTKFGPNNTVAYFPSVTAGWVISEENFMRSLDFIDRLKLRASYGILGSDKIPSYQYISQLDGEATYVWDGGLVNGQAIGTLPNPNIKWEESEQIDVGFDLKMLNNRLDITADYFRKTTKDLLIPSIPVSGILGTYAPGAASPTINAGTVRNEGVELDFGYRGTYKNFVYHINYNITYLQNEVLKVNNGTGFYPGGAFGVGQPWPSRMEEGYPMGYFYGYETDGVFQTQAEVDEHPSQVALGAEAQPGDIRYKDLNDDGVIDADDRTNIGDPIPDFVMGLNLSFKYKGFDFVAYAYANIGNEIVRNYERTQTDVNRLSYTLDRWTGQGTSNEVPRVTTAATSNNVFSDFFVEDGSFLRIQNVQLGYTIPENITQKVKIQKVRIFAGVNNLYTFTNYQGFDPAASTGAPIGGGIDNGFYPTPRIYTFGLNLTF